MKAYILDWNGTLTMLGNRTKANNYVDEAAIKAFLDAIHERGDITISFSGMLPKTVKGWFTLHGGKEILRILESLGTDENSYWYVPGTSDRMPLPTEVILSDDDMYDTSEAYRQWLSDKLGGIPVRFVEPCDLHLEVTP